MWIKWWKPKVIFWVKISKKRFDSDRHDLLTIKLPKLLLRVMMMIESKHTILQSYLHMEHVKK